MLDYYKEKQFIPQTDEKGNVVGKIERWEAHKKGILHKGFTVTLEIDDLIILQHRKHPVFDGVADVTCSSHPLVLNDEPEDEQQAVVRCITREFDISESDIISITQDSSVIYKAKDPNSKYIEHEYCTFYIAKTSKIPQAILDFCYGYTVLEKKYFKKNASTFNLAPWVQEGVDLNL